MNTEQHFKFNRFDGTDFVSWKFDIQSLLLSKNAWGIVTGTEVNPGAGPEDAKQKDFNSRSAMALGLIRLSLDRSQYQIIIEIDF